MGRDGVGAKTHCWVLREQPPCWVTASSDRSCLGCLFVKWPGRGMVGGHWSGTSSLSRRVGVGGCRVLVVGLVVV